MAAGLDDLRRRVAHALGYHSRGAMPQVLFGRVDRAINETEGDIRTRSAWTWLIYTPTTGAGTRSPSPFTFAYRRVRLDSSQSFLAPIDTGKGFIHIAQRYNDQVVGSYLGPHRLVQIVPPEIFLQHAIRNQRDSRIGPPEVAMLVWDKLGASGPEMWTTPVDTEVSSVDGQPWGFTVRLFADLDEVSATTETGIPQDLFECLALGAAWRVAACDVTLLGKVKPLREAYESALAAAAAADIRTRGTLQQNLPYEASRARWGVARGRPDTWPKP